MDCAEVKGQIPAEKQLEPLLILEEGDELDDFTRICTSGKGILRVKKEDMEDRIKGSSERSTEGIKDVGKGESMRITFPQEAGEGQQKERTEYENRRGTETEENTGVKRVQSKPNPVPLCDTEPAAKLRTQDLLSPEDAQHKVMFSTEPSLMRP